GELRHRGERVRLAAGPSTDVRPALGGAVVGGELLALLLAIVIHHAAPDDVGRRRRGTGVRIAASDPQADPALLAAIARVGLLAVGPILTRQAADDVLPVGCAGIRGAGAGPEVGAVRGRTLIGRHLLALRLLAIRHAALHVVRVERRLRKIRVQFVLTLIVLDLDALAEGIGP